MGAQRQRGKTGKRFSPSSSPLGVSFFLLAILTSVAPLKAGEDVLAMLRPSHPRLYVTDDDLRHVRDAVAHDPLARRWHEALRASAVKMLDEPVSEHRLVGPRMLAQTRAALRRISTLAGMYRLDGDRRLADRARQEMLALAEFPDWNPSAFLDVAECTNAMAIGYDWLFDALTPADREKFRDAIVNKGLNEGLHCYATDHWWTTADNNYAQVCAGGLTAGALAIADERRELVRQILSLTRETMRRPMSRFAPDGGWAESPAYWNYATRYNVDYLSALDTALGSDFGLSESPGFADTGLFRIHTIGPTGLCFNYGDGADRPDVAPQMLWLAKRFHRPDYAAHEQALARDRPDIFHLLWFDSPKDTDKVSKLPCSAVFTGVNVATMRTAWNDPRAAFVGFKGGDNRANHAHLDLGSFVLDAFGQRWAVDLGADDYDLPGYFGEHRWEYFRLRTEGHNTLVFDGCNQDPNAKAPIIASGSTRGGSLAVVDLTDAYKVASRVWRGVSMSEKFLVIQDEIELYRPVSIDWNFHTQADVTFDEKDHRNVRLSRGADHLNMRLVEPPGARFEVIPADAPPPQRQQPDVRDLVVRLPEGPKSVRIIVHAAFANDESPPPTSSLRQWIDSKK